MYSDKKQILQLVALLKAHEVKNVVLCPGSRNAPIVQTLAECPFFTCHSVTDERSAGFFALGLALHGGKPAAVVCTSGTALLNIHPAVAEAFYQQVPLVVISADRPAVRIGQMDGQTVPQQGVFGSLAKAAVSLPEIHTDEDLWYCNRLINEALLELSHHGKGPVHINVPLSEPLFGTVAGELPEVRVITRYQGLNVYDKDYKELIARLNRYSRRMMVAGQMTLIYLFEKRTSKLIYRHFAWLTEHLSNRTVPGRSIRNFDTLLHTLSEEQQEKLRPELVITYGGHIVSKRLKKYLRAFPPEEHWHVAADGKAADMFGALTTVIEIDPFEFMERIGPLLENRSVVYPQQWENLSKALPEPSFPYSEQAAVGALLKVLPPESALHLGNSSVVRYACFYSIPETIEVCGNRGTAGIDGSLSAALGYASASAKPNFILTGDLSFFYDMNALWIGHIRSNVRIFLLNNGGGEIFQSLPGFDMTEETRRYVTAAHTTSAKGWAEERGFRYLSARNELELNEALPLFIGTTEKPLLLEVFTDRTEDIRILNAYYDSLDKNKHT
ncbi:2-succinyl-5-enolpyruvyl-6-hydroxy-3- cyclohexene-1-carboxylate synthase [Bacteroidales bacterium Barb6]|nr:2-succinyl-5-enolpyruvyl-6-hydroxy-3- cyclohexene-1-carboxylate synthase [Bacteroidales bacterium Barb6]